ncbi:MAG TPA: LPS export ABC transporter periplasmic protein LptC [Caulobacteraceae bacterium]
MTDTGPSPLQPFDSAEARAEDARRVVDAMRQWRRRSRLIHFARIALPAAIVLLVAGLVTWIVVSAVIAERDAPTPGEIRMTNARFYGQDARGNAFVVGAREAIRDARQAGVVRLIAPRIQSEGAGRRPTIVDATTGTYDENGRTVRLEGQVVIADADEGFRFTAPIAVLDMATGVITGDRGIAGEGPMGSVRAASYGIYDGGARIVFRGRGQDKVQGVLTPRR